MDIKVSQIEYKRQSIEQCLATIADIKQGFESAQNVEQFMEVHQRYRSFSDEVGTQIGLAAIRFTLDTTDEFYSKEQDYYDEIGPELNLALAELSKCYVNSKFRPQLEKIFPPVMFVNMQMNIDANSPLIVEDKVAINKLVTNYTKLMSSISLDFYGEKLTMSAIGKYFSHEDRQVRKSAYYVWGQALEDNKQQLDEIFHQLVQMRTAMGKKMGFDGFAPLGYLNMQRNCYDKEDIAKFRANISKYIVPLASKIRQRVAQELGWDKQYMYDNSVFTKEEPKPIGTPEDIFRAGSEMYHEMDKDTGDLFDRMVRCEAFDVLARPGKWGGGYCTQLSAYKLPFILSNFNGSAGDVDVLTHEFGHAYAASKCMEIDSDFLSSISMETAEVHSMSMEFFAYPWIDKFFGDKTQQYKFGHIASAVTFLPYGTIVDYFQQLCYDNSNMTAAERNQLFNDLESQFLPWANKSGIPAIQDGRRWQRQAHIYESPFYYIDYCLAQFTALQFLSKSLEDYDKALANYKKFVAYGGTKTFVELIQLCGLDSPFEEKSFESVVKGVEKVLSL